MKPTDEVSGRIEQAIDLYEKAGGKWADEARSELTVLKQAVAGAYAAVAKHWPTIGYCFSMYTLECSCGWHGKGSWKCVDKEMFKQEWERHIVALTLDDALKAQSEVVHKAVSAESHRCQEMYLSDMRILKEQVGSEYLIYVPGHFRCTVCGFQLSKQTLSAQTGNIGITENNLVTEPCPNDGTMMVKVTWKEAAENASERLTEVFNERDAARATIASAEDRARLEEHLLTCTDCFDDAKRGTYKCARHVEIVDEAAARTLASTGGQP